MTKKDQPAEQATDGEPLEIAFEELAAVIADKKKSGLDFKQYLDGLKAAADEANRKVELAERARDLCEQTKGRKVRSDAGQPRGPRKRKTAAQQTADPQPELSLGSEPTEADEAESGQGEAA